MDYDDNDFQGQNLHIAGEGSSKFSPLLPPYALPKFDFDDGLQGHLRFDSLVENEVFLGIPSQEDNQWIEDFSRGSSGIDFSSSAAESCSISRRNNVWSEATSSESVEMLLKSVGQEEMVPGETINEKFGACEELGGLTEQMEPHLKQDDIVKDVTDSEPALPAAESQEHCSRLNNVTGTSQTCEAEMPSQGSLHDMDPNASSETCGMVVTDENPVDDRKCDTVNQTKVNSSVDESFDDKIPKVSSGSRVPTDDLDSSPQGVAVSNQVLNIQEPEHQASDISFENANCLLADTGKAVEEDRVCDKETGVDDQNLKGIVVETGTHDSENIPCSSEVEQIEGDAVESGISTFVEPSSLPPKAEGDLHMVEICSENLCSIDPEKASKSELVDFSNGTAIHRQFGGKMHEALPLVYEGDSNLKGHTIEVSSMKTGFCASSELKIDLIMTGENSSVQGEDHLQRSDRQLDSETLVSNSEAPLLSSVAHSSAELLGEKPTVENLKSADDTSRVLKEDTNKEGHASSPTEAGSMETENPNDGHYDQGVSFDDKETAKLASNSSNMDCEIVDSISSGEMVESLSQGEAVKVKNEVVPGSECVTTTTGNEPALNVAFQKTNMALHGTVDGVPVVFETGASVNQVNDHLDESRKTKDECPTEANLLPSKESLEGDEQGLVLKLRKGESGSSAGKLPHHVVEQSLPTESCNSESGGEQAVKLLHKTADHSLPMAETCNVAGGSEQALKENEICQDSSHKFEVSHIPCDSAVKESNDAERLVPGNHEEVAVVKNHEVASSKFAGGGSSVDSDKPSCGISAVTTRSVLCQSEKDEKMGLEGSVSKCLPLSELTAQSSSQTVSGNDAAKDERSFSFAVHPSVGLSEERDTSKDGLTAIQACKIPTIVEGSSTPSVGQMDPKLVVDLSCGSSRAPDGEIARRVSKGTPERRTRRGSGRATGKQSAKKGNHMKEITPMRQIERGEKSHSASVNPSGTGLLVQFEGMKSYGNVERSGAIPCGVVSIPTSNLPDLNTSTLQSALYQQPFTDLQQVQLRAQIFVYGSLIQGAAPDEACMGSAFGASDGGRSVWEPVWRACVERIQGQKSLPNKLETPLPPRSGARPSDQSVKQGSHESKVVPSPLGRASSKGTTSPVVNSMIPLSSPLWNVSTPSDSLQSIGMPRSGLLDYHQTVPPLHPFQTPPARSFVGHAASWLSQAPFPGPWVASPQTSAFDGSARFSMLPMTETVKLTPVKESVSVSSGSKFSSPSSVVDSLGPGVLAGTSSLPDMKKSAALPVQNSTDMKTRKRKKATVCEDLGHISFAQTLTEQVSAPIVTSHLSTSVVVSAPARFVSKDNARKIVTGTSPTSSSDLPKRGEQNAEPKVITSEETISKVEEAKREAEDAASLAAAAVSHSQSVWSQLDKQKYSGSILDVEARLSSAAAAVAAAASVAKAAAAAAKIASNAALQAKLMAEEALASSGASNPSQSKAASLPNVVTNLGKATPASILNGGDGSNCSSSIIVAAREAARRRVEAASAASKHAENLDAIVKAAELAAEAVSQAGKIVAMGEPVPLNELVEAGAEGYLRGPQVPSELGVKSNNDNREQSKIDSIKGLNVPGRYAKDGSSEEAKAGNRGLSPLTREVSLDTTGDHTTRLDSISISFTTGEKDSRGQKSRKASDLAKTIGVVPESEFGPKSATTTAQEVYEKGVGTLKEHSIKEGCLVEVRKDGDAVKTAWFSANVLSLKDGKAFVCYTELQSDEGSGKLREWVALESEASNAPTIRIPHPMTTMRFEGTRKRRRAAMGDYVWSVGDRVDAWMDDCWREGVVTEKNKKDDTTLTVHFPADGETAVVKAWHLRPALIWKDGEWIEWLSSRQKDPSSQGDTPQEKRLKSGIPAVEGRDQVKMSKNIGLDESQLLPLSANEKVFNVGKNIRGENQPNALRTARSGLQEEGSRVIFGVPKPGKKRKFMEVSKHYVAEKSSKSNESSDSVKFAKYLMPRGSGSRGWKYSTKIDTKEKHAAESKNKVIKSGKAQTVSGRTLPQKNKFLTSAQSDGTAMDHMIDDSVRTDENASGQQSLMEFGSFSKNEGPSEGPVLFSSLALPSNAPSKKISTSNPKSELVNRGKLGPSSGKLAKAELKEKLNNDNPGKSEHEVVEPRRSVRRIQPTSRLLEGLQSSLIISKIPAVSHDKSHRGQNRGTSKGNNHG